MSTKILLSKNIISSLVLAGSFMISAVIIVHANSPFDIEFPIPELNNCANKNECKAYCDNPENEVACHAFAAKHGLGGSRDEVDAKLKTIETDGGPGNCARDSENPNGSCRQYCGKQENIKECIRYAKAHNIMEGRELEEAEKVLKALEAGVPLPAGCTSEESCRHICEKPKDVTVARSCFEFADKAGLLPPGVTREKAEKMFKAIEEGRAPFKSPREFEQCENPQTDEILEKCVKFGLENDLIPPEEAEMIRKTGGKGPGNCRGKEQCETYCEEHQDECFKFAEEHNLIREEDKERMREGMSKFKEALDNAPPEVSTCLKSTVGEEVIQKIISGSQPPTRDLGEKMHLCFENFFKAAGNERGDFRREDGERSETQFQGIPANPRGNGGASGALIPSEIRPCLEEKLGADVVLKIVERQAYPPQNFREMIQACITKQMGAGQRREAGYEGGGRRYNEMPPAGYPQRPPSSETPQVPPQYFRPGGANMMPSNNYYAQPTEGGTNSYPPPGDGSYDINSNYQLPEGTYMPGTYYPTQSGDSTGSFTPPPSEPTPLPVPSSPSGLFFFPTVVKNLLANLMSLFFAR